MKLWNHISVSDIQLENGVALFDPDMRISTVFDSEV